MMNSLLDFYGTLLTEKQLEICTYYYCEDLSLQEISEIMNVSRAAVYDTVRRSRDELIKYEEKLGLVKNYELRIKLYDKIKLLTDDQQIYDLLDQCLNTESEGGLYE
ncbi:MAG: YlxM family DNA-binding protein [Erysipelotrichaceae bacterium]|nr:YlxM family DNA-binding protein [Erysipelotrichaceae bacterium]